MDRPIHVAGNPCNDLLRPELRPFYQPEIEDLRKRYGNFMLVNTILMKIGDSQ
jgi:hypothetical protein